jgi:glutamine synthetase
VAGDQRERHAADPRRRHREDRPVHAAHDAVDHLRRARPDHKKEYSRDPRSIARKCDKYLKGTGIADTAYFGPELEFFIFDQRFYDQGINYAKYYVGSREGIWGRGDEDPPTSATRSA